MKKIIVARLIMVAAVICTPAFVRADIVGPYSPDANTLYLFHFDEVAGSSVTTNVGIKGGNSITVTNTTTGNGLATPPIVTTMLGKTSYPGFGNCVSATNTVDPTLNPTLVGLIGYDGNRNGVYDADVSGAGIAADAIAMTNLNIGNSNAFTIEALVNCGTNIVGTVNQEIVCTDNGNGPQRGFQFRINGNGQLEFNFIGAPTSGSKVAGIPTTGPNAFVINTWFHAAVTYDGTNLFLYWTKLDPSSTACNQIGGPFAWNSTTNGATVSPLVIGNENRGSSTEQFKGLIDEVRISSVCRGPGQMMFTSPGVTIVQQPSAQSIDYFQPVTFNVTASSTTPIGYQWRFNGTPISTATNVSYVIPSVDLSVAGNYDVVITNTAGFAATSSPALLIVGSDHFLAHRWSFNGDATDSVGGATGTLEGSATISSNALVLDGTTGCYLQLPSLMLYNSNYTAVTFEFWATYNTSGNNDRVFDFGNTNFVNAVILPPENYVYFSPHTGANHALGFSPTTSESQISATGTGNLDGQVNMYVACVVDPPNNVMSIYTNGVFETSATLSTTFSSIIDQNAWIGRSQFAADSFINGSIDEFRIYSGALSPSSVAQSFSQGPNVPLNAGPVTILIQPTNTTGAVGFPVSIIAALIGRAPISVQWYENGSPIGGATNPVYTFTPTLSQDGHMFQVLATNTVSGTNYNVASSNATLTVTVPETLVWSGVNGSSWDTSTLNWSNSTPALVSFAQFDGVLFDNRGGSQPVVNLVQPVSLTAMTVSNNANDYLIQSAGSSGSLNGQSVTFVKAGTGKLTLDVNNNSIGTTVIQNGTLQLGNADGVGTLVSGPVTNNATLAFNRTNAVTMTNNISGSGIVILSGTSDLSLSGSNSYVGVTIISSTGTLHPKNANALGMATAGLINTNGGRLYVDVNVDFPNEPLTLGGGTSLQKGGGVSTLGGPITLMSDTAFSIDGGATLNLTNASGLNGNGVNINFTMAGSGVGNITGPLSFGTGNLTVSGGTWTVASSNNYNLTAINAGTLLITGPLSLGQPPGSFNASQVTLNGGGLGAATNVTLNDGKIGINVSEVSTASAITVNSNATFTISNDISGDGSTFLTKTGAGTLVLNGANDFAGTLNIDSGSATANDGMTVIANNAAIANILVFSGIPGISLRNNNSGSSTLALDGTLGSINVAPDISLSGRNVVAPAIENLAGNNTISGGFTLNIGGAYVLQSDNGTLTLTANYPQAVVTNIISSRVLTFKGTGIITMSGAIQDVFNGTANTNVPINILKDGIGTLNLPAVNTYSGTTVVSNGVLSVTGSVSSSGGVTNVGGLVVGNGAIGGPVTVLPGGSIEAGTTNAIGTLTLGNTLTLGGNTIVKINKFANAHDLFNGQSSVTYGGTLTVTNLAGTPALGDNFTLFSPGASASNFGNITGTPGPNLHYTFTNGVLNVVAGNNIASNPTNILFSVSGSNLTLSWPSDHLGWILQSQTNTLSAGLSTNWFDVSGSDTSTQAVVNLNPASPSVFYRLRHP